MEVKRDTFIFYRSFRDALDDLPDDVRGRLYKAIADYALDQIEPNFPVGVESAVWKLIEPQLKANMKKYIASLKGGNPNFRRRNDTSNGLTNDTSNGLTNDTSNGLTNDTSNGLTDDTSNGLTNDTSNGLTITPTIPQPNDKCIMNNDKGVMKNDSVKEFVANAPNSSSTFGNVDTESESEKPQEGSSEVQKPSRDTEEQEDLPKEGIKIPLEIKDRFDYVAFAKFFNDEMDKAGAAIRRVSKLNQQRMSWIRARVKEYSKEDVARVVRKAAASNYLNGGGPDGWKATFDWIFRPRNFPKILEGNYDNDTNIPNDSSSTLTQWAGGRCAAGGQGTKSEFNAEALKRAEAAVLRVVQGVDEPQPDF